MGKISPTLRVVTLNVGRGLKHLDRTVEFLNTCDADVLCLQDVQERHLGALVGAYPTRHFVPMCRHLVAGGHREPVGIGIFSRFPFQAISAHAYVGSVLPVHDLQGVEVDAEGNSRNHDLALVRATESRLALFVEIELGGEIFKIGTTHGTWVPGGKTDDHQKESMMRFAQIAVGQGPMVLAGDLNAGRGGEIYEMLTAKGLQDCVPARINNTLDPDLHPLKGRVEVVSDYFLGFGDAYQVSDVQVTFSVSDHGALSGTVSLKS
ncbi:MAG: endonuclease/exonuclease/phosphatase family protein [Candidatus Paceibacterota bacterium]